MGCRASWRGNHQFVFAPELAKKPILQSSSSGLAVEDIVGLRPDLVLTMDRSATDKLAGARTAGGVAEMAGAGGHQGADGASGGDSRREKGRCRICALFRGQLARIETTLGTVEESKRPRVLYVNYRRLTQPHRIAEWWIRTPAAAASPTMAARRRASPSRSSN